MDAGFDPINTEQKQNTAQGTQGGGYRAYAASPAEQQHEKKATTAMVLGILGDACFLPPLLNIVGLTLSILALVRANANRRFAKENGIAEDGKNIAGRWCGIGGIVLNGLSILFWMLLVIILVLSMAVYLGNFGNGAAIVLEELF